MTPLGSSPPSADWPASVLGSQAVHDGNSVHRCEITWLAPQVVGSSLQRLAPVQPLLPAWPRAGLPQDTGVDRSPAELDLLRWVQKSSPWWPRNLATKCTSSGLGHTRPAKFREGEGEGLCNGLSSRDHAC